MVLGGYGGHRPMIWRPSDMVSICFDGRSVMDGCVVRERVRYFCTYLTKKMRSAPTPNFAPT
jgi:hypothetical protein